MATLNTNLGFLDGTDLPAALTAEQQARASAVAAEAAARVAAIVAETTARQTALGNEASARASAIAAEANARTAAVNAALQAAAAAQAAATAAANTASAARSEIAALKSTGAVSSPDTTLFPEFPNDAAALAGGMTLGGIYRTTTAAGSVLKVVSTTGGTPPVTPTRNPVFSNNIANAVLGTATSVTVTGLLPNEAFTWSVVLNDPPTYTRRSTPLKPGQANGAGVATLPATFVATNDLLGLFLTNPVGQVYSTTVKTTNSGNNGGNTSGTLRGRPQISGGTVKSEQGSFLRGGTMALDEIGSLASNYATNRANWTLFRNLGLNIVRLPFSLSYVGVSLSAQLEVLDVCIENAAQSGLYCMPMFDWDYGQSNYPEMLSVWPTICARYKDRTHVLFEMQNEPHWNAGEHTSGELDSIAQVYAAMRAAAPNSLIGVLTPASVETSTGILSAASQLVTRGVDIGTKAFVTFHAYGNYSRAAIQELKAARPCMLTETTSGGPASHSNPNNEVFKLGEMETLGISWQMLPARFGEINNTDTPYSNDQETMTARVLPDLHAAGYNWTADPLTTTTTPSTGEARILSVTGRVSEAVIGSPTTMTITAADTTSIMWVPVRADWSWYVSTAIGPITLNGSGQCTVQWTPTASGDRIVAWPTGFDGRGLESLQVPQQTTGGGGGGGGTLPPVGTNTVRIDFANNNGGALNHTWGDTSGLSYTNGILRIQQIPGSTGNPEGACGVMMGPWSASGGYGYGYYEWRVRFFGSGPGPCALLWAADDSWPRAEEDMGEITGGGDWYCAHHWDAGGGNNQFEIFSYRSAFPSRGDLPRGLWVTVGCLIKPGYLEYFVDRGQGAESIGSTTNNITPMYADGGVNRVPGVMQRGTIAGCAIEAQWFQYTPLSSVGAAPAALPQRPLGIYVLQNVVPSEIAAAPVNVKVVDVYNAAGTLHTTAQVATMKAGNALLLGYFSIGEAEDYRDYFASIPSSAIGPVNPQWPGNFQVAYWTPEWLAVAKAYIDKMLTRGYEGVYFDVVDEWGLAWAKANVPGGGETNARNAMVTLIGQLRTYARATDPNFKIWVNNSEELLDNATYRGLIDGMYKENLFYQDNGVVQPGSETTGSMAFLQLLLNDGKPVVCIEYVNQNATKIADVKAKAAARGLGYYTANIDLIGVNTGGFP